MVRAANAWSKRDLAIAAAAVALQAYATRSGFGGPCALLLLIIAPFVFGRDAWDGETSAYSVFNAAVEKAYGGKRRVAWMEILAGEKAHNQTGEWLPKETLEAIKRFRIAIKGPLTTPVGGGFRSLNVSLRQMLNLYVCLRPVRYYPGVPSPMRNPEKLDVVIFRENTEDVYAGIEWREGSEDAAKEDGSELLIHCRHGASGDF